MARKVTRRNSRRRSTRVARRSTRRSARRSARRSTRRSARRSARALKRSIRKNVRRSTRRSTRRKNVKRSSRRSTRKSNRRRNMRKEIMVGGMEAAMEDMPVKPEPAPLETMVKHMSNGLTDWVEMNKELDNLTLVNMQQEFPQLHAALLECLDSVCAMAPAEGGGKSGKKGKKGKPAGDDKRAVGAPKPKIANRGFGRGSSNSDKSLAAVEDQAVADAEMQQSDRSAFSKALDDLNRGQEQMQAEAEPPGRELALATVLGKTPVSFRLPNAVYQEPPDSRPIWNPSFHGVMVGYWHPIVKNAFKALISFILSYQSVAGAATAFTVSQLFGTLDKLLITLISVGIGTACAGIATYTGAAVAGVSLYTILRSAYGRAAGNTREELVSNVAASCYVADAHLRDHVTTTAQEISNGFLNTPTFIELLQRVNASVDHLSSALAGLFMSRFVRKMYRPPDPTPETIADVTRIIGGDDYYKTPILDSDGKVNDPWLLALVRTKTQIGGNAQFIPLFDKWGCISIPAIHERDDVPAEKAGREQVQAVLEGGRQILAAPSQIIHDNEQQKYEKKYREIQNAFRHAGSSDDISTLGRYIIEGLHDYFSIREIKLTSPDELASIPPAELAEEIDLFLRAWEDPQSVIPVSEPPGQQKSVQAALGLSQGPPPLSTPAVPTPIPEEDTQSPGTLSPSPRSPR